MEVLSAEVEGGSGHIVEKLPRRTRSGSRIWSKAVKGRAVFESMKPGARVCDVAQRYGVSAQQLTMWRKLARSGRLALVTDEATDFVPIEVSETASRKTEAAPVEISIGKVTIRLDRDATATRIAEIATVLERGA